MGRVGTVCDEMDLQFPRVAPAGAWPSPQVRHVASTAVCKRRCGWWWWSGEDCCCCRLLLLLRRLLLDAVVVAALHACVRRDDNGSRVAFGRDGPQNAYKL